MCTMESVGTVMPCQCFNLSLAGECSKPGNLQSVRARQDNVHDLLPEKHSWLSRQRPQSFRGNFLHDL